MKDYIVALADIDDYTNHIRRITAESKADATRIMLESHFGSMIWNCDVDDIDHLCMDGGFIINAVEVE